MTTIVIDAMGGDYAPAAPVTAAIQMARAYPDTTLILAGDESKMKQHLGESVPSNIIVRHTADEIAGTDEPVRAVRRKPNSSLVVGAKLVHDKDADVMISAGNTGAIVAAGLLVIGRLENVQRPALSPVLPTFSGKGIVLLDAGATMDASAENLLEFALMADAYVKHVLDVDSPRIGLLNVGTEDSKGNALTKAAFPLLQQSKLNFIGNVEARDLLDGPCDVVVCDGFAGNVVLKLAEGVGLGIFKELRSLFMSTLKTKILGSLLKPSMRAFRDKFDYAEYGGAPFLGVAGGCFKAHGSSNPRAWYIALVQARKFANEHVLEKIQQAMADEVHA